MRRSNVIAGILATFLIAACTSGPPRAPGGLARRPANAPAVIAELRAAAASEEARPASRIEPLSAPSPLPQAPVASSPRVAPATMAGVAGRGSGDAARLPMIVIVSDFSAPGGIAALPLAERSRLIAAARAAQSVAIYARSDRRRPSRVVWRALVRRGQAAKRYLVGQGVDAARIRVFARSWGAFAADDTNRAGRARNRRIEIHLM